MLPKTIKHPKAFLLAPAAGFDGVFDWSWTEGCFGGKITPMDIDGLVERKGQFLIFDVKRPGTPIPKGQQITLNRLHSLGCFTIMYIEGKESPETLKIHFRHSAEPTDYGRITKKTAQKYVAAWYRWANNV